MLVARGPTNKSKLPRGVSTKRWDKGPDARLQNLSRNVALLVPARKQCMSKARGTKRLVQAEADGSSTKVKATIVWALKVLCMLIFWKVKE